MDLNDLLELYTVDPRTAEIVDKLHQSAAPRIYLQGLAGSLDAFLCSAIFKKRPQPHLYVLPNKEQAAYFQNDLKNILKKKDILFFPDSFKKTGQFGEVNKSNVLLRTETLGRLLNSVTTGELMVTYPEALFEKVVNTAVLSENTLHIKLNESLDTAFIIELLVEYGFEHADFVYEPGQFSIRGGIIDIYSFGNEKPYRVELFDDEVESIRIFDPITQLSDKKISQVTIVPNINAHFESREKTSLLQLLPEQTTFWFKDFEGFEAKIQSLTEEAKALVSQVENPENLPDHSFFKGNFEEAFVKLADLQKDIAKFGVVEFGHQSYLNGENWTYQIVPQPPFNKNFELLIEEFQKNTKNRFLNFIFTDNSRQVKRFQHIFQDLGADIEYNPVQTALHEGFIDKDLKLACYTDHQIFDRFYKYKIKQSYSKRNSVSIKLLNELNRGDFVTHIDHGVGKFMGLQKLTVNDKTQETVRIEYKDGDMLFVGIHSLHKIAKYIGQDGRKPKIFKLGSNAWANLKRKTKSKIKDIAKDLIVLYAKRKASTGHAFAPDSFLQTELEASFIYEDTPDQLKATQDVKADMEAIYPMDRLVCGDVGFGKTEIAIRATAKALADNKQVAILVPTTILVMQHFKTFTERLKDFPCKVDFLNRFKTAKQKKETIEKLKTGEVDVIIGTHALTSKSVAFKDLGLLVIDEEQKFGVAVKEKLRNMKVNVDTLTLTATPIPRTLQFSLMSARDLSIIRTPPPNRQPIHTELMTFKAEKIRDAIYYEIYRGGQVFFIHNRVKDIQDMAAMIQKHCPDLDIGVAHGQLDNKKLEEQMIKFEKRTYDVLLCTNIVESGLDIPNANTIIINNAHWFGLSDLHQLRGRVGRSNQKAFCYLISPPVHSLPEDSKKRLTTIKQFADLGSGFNIAMKDLDIRGAGNLLGGEQSGFIADIGFETYQKILTEAIQELKESDFKEVFKDQFDKEKKFVKDCQVETDLDMLIPTYYVNSTNERLLLYQELNNIEVEEDLQEFKKRLVDRFGPISLEVNELLYGVRLKWVATRLGFERIIIKSGKMRCYFVENRESLYYKSPIFLSVLNHIQSSANKRKSQLKQTPKSLILIIERVAALKEARKVLSEIEEAISGKLV